MGKDTTRSAATGQFKVSTPAGRTLVIKGAGSLREGGLKIMRGVDLTKPITKQVMRHNRDGSLKKA